ncbi:uncharacterized mitochondrial protein AtMg00810-like [Benincasa hispida]|uniref:uncharacterized mitochondrial protein AtMg00810-like n=1 Tax=Benincasa hispida TaxID=102211 RepID=UPI001901275A|nr:uncharacterized mitochondrial protein AtMg00810-like [Benincasa hispida]
MGFYQSRSDTSLFIYRTKGSVIFLLVYVDDVIITGNKYQLTEQLIETLDIQFALKDLGQLRYFLGIQVHYLDSGLLINQSKYVDDLLHELHLTDVKPMLSPTVQGRKLSKTDGQPLFEPYIYRSTIDALQYLTHTRPDITYVVNQLSQFLQTPTDVHWQAAKRVLRYISSTKHYGLYFQPSLNLNVFAYSDANWASNLDDRKSVAAYCTFVGNNIVSWSSIKQAVVA